MTYTPPECFTSHLIDRDATVVELKTTFNGKPIIVTGSSKRENGDPFNADLGYTLAFARAAANLSKALLKEVEPDVG